MNSRYLANNKCRLETNKGGEYIDAPVSWPPPPPPQEVKHISLNDYVGPMTLGLLVLSVGLVGIEIYKMVIRSQRN